LAVLRVDAPPSWCWDRKRLGPSQTLERRFTTYIQREHTLAIAALIRIAPPRIVGRHAVDDDVAAQVPILAVDEGAPSGRSARAGNREHHRTQECQSEPSS
jgi:hypothetical protein